MPRELTAAGSLLCNIGTRYCRDGFWSACEGIKSFEAPPASRYLPNALIDQDAAAQSCDPCHPDCYRLDDPLQPDGDAGPPGTDVEYNPGGGITLTGYANDAALPSGDELDIIPPCDPAADTDCDGVPNALDPYPLAKPFTTDHTTIFMDLPPDASGSSTRVLEFSINTADVYFLIDMTGSMGEEKSVLFNSLTSQNFLDDPSTTGVDESATVTCPDGDDADDQPDQHLKDQGITGNIACLIKDSGFGLGWFREIPFSASDNYGIKYAYPDFEAYEHRQDISVDVSLTSNALDLLYTRGNQNWAESATVALSAVATGGPIYMGWDRPGIPPKVCPPGRFGYPCFRDEAIPIVVLITDAPMMNGPVPPQGHLGNENSNYPSSGGDLQPVNYQPNGLRYTSLSSDATYHPVTSNESYATAYNVGVIDNSFKTYTGDTRGMTADLHMGNLGTLCLSGAWPGNAINAASPGYPDAVFKFTVESAKTLKISTRGTRHQPSLAIVPASAANAVATSVTANGSNHDAASAQDLSPTSVPLSAPLNLEITGDSSLAAYATGTFPTYAMKECFRGTGGSTWAPDAVYKFSVAEDMPSVSFSATGDDFQAVLALYETLPAGITDTTLTNTNDKHWDTGAVFPTGTATTPGTLDGRAVWLRGGDTSSLANNYATSFFTNVSGDSTCNNVVGSARDVVIDFRLTGTRTIDIETTGSTDSTAAAAFDHVIALMTRPASAATAAPAAATYCNRNGAGTQRSRLTTTLNAGAGTNYSLVLRGERLVTSGWPRTDDKGKYGVIINDSSAQPRACHNQSSSSSFTTSLSAGVTYYLVMRGRHTSSGGGSGPYNIRISSEPTGTCAYDNTTYAGGTGDSSYNPHAAEITQVFEPGEYYAVLKGNADNANWNPDPPTSDRARGWYQLTLGDPTLAINNQIATMPVWGNGASGVMSDLNAQNIHVINVTSTIGVSGYNGGAANQNQALKDQADIISNATGATSTAGTPLRFDIQNNGSGMGFAVVDAINKLTNNLKMDVSVRFVPSPDAPTAPQAFVFQSRAVDDALDDCDGVMDANGDGVLETHTGCVPGAKPRFELTFTNPPATSPLSASRHVRPNGTKGGYDMRVEVIGDGQYVVDSVPVYIVPEDVVEDPPAYLYNPTGSYTQDVSSTGCMGTERPDWQSLYWNGTLPPGTSMEWRMCAGETADELQACVSASAWKQIAEVHPGGECTSSADCPNGYCTPGGYCEYPERSGCSSDSECGNNGTCVSNTCVWTANPIDLKPAVATGFNGMKRVRLQLIFHASPSQAAAPSISDLRLNYVCAPGE